MNLRGSAGDPMLWSMSLGGDTGVLLARTVGGIWLRDMLTRCSLDSNYLLLLGG